MRRLHMDTLIKTTWLSAPLAASALCRINQRFLNNQSIHMADGGLSACIHIIAHAP